MNRIRKKGIYCYFWDFLDEGIDTVLDNIKSWNGNSIALAMAYHAGKFILPHNPTTRVYFPQDGRTYFPIDTKYYHTPLRPIAANIVDGNKLMEIITKCRAQNIEFQTWLVLLHNSYLGNKHPQYTVKNVFGDHYPYALCPTQEAVQEYVKGIVYNLLDTFPVKKLFFESLSFMGFCHGYHHEMYGLALSGVQKTLLGFCFCDACLARAAEEGIDVKKLTKTIKNAIDNNNVNILDRSPELSQFIKIRCNIVADLLTKINKILKKYDAEFDIFGPVFEDSCAKAILEGIDLVLLNKIARYYVLPVGQADIDIIRNEIKYALQFLPAEKIILSISMRHESMSDKENFIGKIKLIEEFNLRGENFYNYGTIPLEKLQWIKEVK